MIFVLFYLALPNGGIVSSEAGTACEVSMKRDERFFISVLFSAGQWMRETHRSKGLCLSLR